MLIYGRDKGRREICSNIFDIKAFPLYTLPETIQGIRTLSFSDMEYAAASQVHDDCLVNMPFPDGKLINANAIGENGAYPPTKSGSIHPLLS